MSGRLLGRSFLVDEPSAIAAARTYVMQRLRSIGTADARAADAALVVTEIGTNLLKHAEEGEVLVTDDGRRLSIYGIDEGPGIDDVHAALTDGRSNKGTAGIGMGAMLRKSDRFEIDSQPGVGTIVVSHFGERAEATLEWDALLRAKPGEDACGDGIEVELIQDTLLVSVVDGLGHGPEAERATNRILEARGAERDPEQAMRNMHEAARGTRGGVAVVLTLNMDGTGRMVGVGNVTAFVDAPGGRKHLLSKNGSLGMAIPRLHVEPLTLDRGSQLIVHTDGLRRVSHDLPLGEPSVTAGHLYRAHARRSDDASVLVLGVT